jgi:hypothetical protein
MMTLWAYKVDSLVVIFLGEVFKSTEVTKCSSNTYSSGGDTHTKHVGYYYYCN